MSQRSMSIPEASQNNNCKLAQYYHYFLWKKDGYAKEIFLEESNINRQIVATKYLEQCFPELIGCTALHLANEKGNLSDIEFLLSKGADFMIRNQNGSTPLLFAVESSLKYIYHFSQIKSGCAALLSAQIKSGNLENPRDASGLSHFHIACMADHAEAVELFLLSGISVNETINDDSKYFPGFTPLHFTAIHSALEAMKVLLNYGANTKLNDAAGMTFFCKLLKFRFKIIQPPGRHVITYSDSIRDENLKMLRYLLENYSYDMNIDGLTNFHLACSISELPIADEHLLQNITDINQALDKNAPFWQGCTPLHFAAYSSIEMVKILVKNGASILAKDANGVTPLDMCLEKYGVEDIHAVLSLDANWKSILMSDRKTRLLSLIFAMKDERQFDNFLEARMDIINTIVPFDSPVWQGLTPLHIAVMFCEKDMLYFHEDKRSEYIIKKLITNGANINAQDIRGRSPLNLAFREPSTRRYGEGIKYLLEFNEKIKDVIDDENLSHLHIACEANDKELIKKILQANVDVNIAFKGKSKVHYILFGTTPLHCAVHSSDEEVEELLLLQGADPLLKDSNGKTAIHYSDDGRYHKVLSWPQIKEVMVIDSGLGLSHLDIACNSGNVLAAKNLLDNGADVNQQIAQLDDSYNTPLDVAISYSEHVIQTDFAQIEMVDLLFRRGAEMLIKDVLISDTEFHDKESNSLKPFILSLNPDDELFERWDKEIGLTSLHMACFRKDINLIKTLLANGTNVNAQINVKSRLWSGHTPLHVVMYNGNFDDDLDEIVRILLDNGANVTIPVLFEGETALHLAYERINRNLSNNRYSFMKMILKAHKDFGVNPTRKDNLSFLHMACSIGDIVSIEKFAKHGVNLNQHTEFFVKEEDRHSRVTIGSTPLHLATASSEYGVDRKTQLELIDLLLNYGADVHAQDINGNTSLHVMTKSNFEREEVILRLVKSGANMNRKNIWDETPLELLMKTKNGLTVDEISYFSKIVYHMNLEMNSTVMHVIVSTRNKKIPSNQPLISTSQYIVLFKELEKFDCDIDDQDKLGRTPLHLAVIFRNIDAIVALHVTGADMNILDLSEKTPFSYIFEPCVKCFENDSNNLIVKHSPYEHFQIFTYFVICMKNLLHCKLDVNQFNQNLMFKAIEKLKSENMTVPKLFYKQIKKMGSIKIPKSRLTLRKFLSEIDAVITYSTLPQTERDAVNKFVEENSRNWFTEYKVAAGILILQYRKAVKRLELNESARYALNILANLRLPDLCSVEILNLLTNSDLKSMIKATSL